MIKRLWNDQPLLDPPMASRRALLAWAAASGALVACGGSQGERDPEALPRTEEGWHTARCLATTSDAKGPYYESGAPPRTIIRAPNEPGTLLTLTGRVLGPDCRTPMAGYTVDVWQADASGHYYQQPAVDNYRLRGTLVTNDQGAYHLETVVPGRYADQGGTRPAHIHVTVRTPASRPVLTTQLYFKGDPWLGNADYCTREGTCDSSDPARQLVLGGTTTARTATCDIILRP